ncbi:hypothetical protein U0070_022895 [Myodes glareolus]|uniref:NXF1/2/3/5-like leucine-rich repeat domain-containing protein n=1 Tax=Myodes glareolus TaxID=447135 RepID=A0AAW0H4Z8_MYOGA
MITIYANSSTEPVSVQYQLTPEQMHILKKGLHWCWSRPTSLYLLTTFSPLPEDMDHGIDIFLNRRSCMTATLQIIEVDFPELKTVWELEKVKGLKLEELWLEGNPLCSTFPDHSAYVSAVLSYFPELLCLNGWKSLPTIGPHTLEIRKPREESYRRCASLKDLVMQFMFQRSLEEYIKDSRNMKRLKDSWKDVLFFHHWGVQRKLCTVNDEMILRNASPAETKKAFSTTMPTVFYSQSHQQMKHSSTQTDFL